MQCLTSYVYTRKAVRVAKLNNYIELYVSENYGVWTIVNDNAEFNRKLYSCSYVELSMNTLC